MKSRRCATRKQKKKKKKEIGVPKQHQQLTSAATALATWTAATASATWTAATASATWTAATAAEMKKTQREEKNLLVRSRLHFLFHRQTSRLPKSTFVS